MMIMSISIPSSYHNKLELETTLNAFVHAKLLDRFLDRSKVVSIRGSLRKSGKKSKFTINLKYGKQHFQVIKQDKDPFVASMNALKSLKRLCIENNDTSKMSTRPIRFRLDDPPAHDLMSA